MELHGDRARDFEIPVQRLTREDQDILTVLVGALVDGTGPNDTRYLRRGMVAAERRDRVVRIVGIARRRIVLRRSGTERAVLFAVGMEVVFREPDAGERPFRFRVATR